MKQGALIAALSCLAGGAYAAPFVFQVPPGMRPLDELARDPSISEEAHIIASAWAHDHAAAAADLKAFPDHFTWFTARVHQGALPINSRSLDRSGVFVPLADSHVVEERNIVDLGGTRAMRIVGKAQRKQHKGPSVPFKFLLYVISGAEHHADLVYEATEDRFAAERDNFERSAKATVGAIDLPLSVIIDWYLSQEDIQVEIILAAVLFAVIATTWLATRKRPAPRTSTLAKLAVCGALCTSAIAAFRIVHLAAAPPPLSSIRAPLTAHGFAMPTRLVVAMPQGLLVIQDRAAYRLLPSLEVEPLEWPELEFLWAEAVAILSNGDLALLLHSGQDQRRLLMVSGHRAQLVPLSVPPRAKLVGLHSAGDHFVLFAHTDDENRTTQRLEITAEGVTRSETVQTALSAAQLFWGGVVWRGEVPLIVAPSDAPMSQRLVGFDGVEQPLPTGLRGFLSISMMRPYSTGPFFFDRHGQLHPTRSRSYFLGPNLALTAEGELWPIDQEHDSTCDEQVTHFLDRELELKSENRRIALRTHLGDRFREVASGYGPELRFFPVGDRWIALPEFGAQGAMVIDADGRRIDRVSRWRSLATAAGDPSLGWLLLVGLLFALTFGTLLALAWNRLTLLRPAKPGAIDRPSSIGVFAGTLQLSEGDSLATARFGRRVQKVAEVALVVGTTRVTLDGPLDRSDSQPQVPLIDGDAVYVHGNLVAASGTPSREGEKLRLIPIENTMPIGRGDMENFDVDRAARVSMPLFRLAFCHLLVGIIVLSHFGLHW